MKSIRNAILSDGFGGSGVIVTPDTQKSLSSLEYWDVVSLFEEQGAILFRGFDVNPQNLLSFTDSYTEQYSGDAQRRAYRFDQKAIRGVDGGTEAILLHSEASFTPAWPEIIWFFCQCPPASQGATILCDGTKLWRSLSSKTKDFFSIHPIRYDLHIPIGKKIPGRNKRPWSFNTLGACHATIDWHEGVVQLTQVRSPLTEGRGNGSICFANHLLIHLESEPQLLNRSLIDGSAIPADYLSEIRSAADSLTEEISWERNDLLMLDNKRFMHGRRAYLAGDPRDIAVVQTARASFGYGATTRRTAIPRKG